MKYRSVIEDYIIMTVGCLLTALAFNFFFVPNQIAPGGLSGVGTVMFYLFKFPVGVTTLVLNIPLFLIGIKQLGGKFGIRTLFATVMLSLFLDLVKVPALTNDSLLASIYGGFLMGVGIGLLFRKNATTGGTDLLAQIVHRFFPIISVAWVMFAIDFLVVISAALVFGPSQALYAIVALVLSAKVIDLVQEGMKSAKATFIISDKSQEIAQRIMKQMDRGVTILNGKGAFTGNSKEVLLCAVNRLQIAELKGLIHEIDPDAFVLVTDVREILGEGF